MSTLSQHILESRDTPEKQIAALAEALDESWIAMSALRKDAERYRWLREKYDGFDSYYGHDMRFVLIFDWPADKYVGKDLDLTIDSAMAGHTPQHGEEPK